MIPIMATSPNDCTMGTVETNIAANPSDVASIAYITAGPVRVMVMIDRIIKRAFPGLLVEPGMELDRVIDPKPDHDRECAHHRHVELDPGKAHQAKGRDKAQPYKHDREEPVADIGEEQAHDDDHQDHGGTDQDAHLGTHRGLHLGRKCRTAGDRNLDSRRGLGVATRDWILLRRRGLGVV